MWKVYGFLATSLTRQELRNLAWSGALSSGRGGEGRVEQERQTGTTCVVFLCCLLCCTVAKSHNSKLLRQKHTLAPYRRQGTHTSETRCTMVHSSPSFRSGLSEDVDIALRDLAT